MNLKNSYWMRLYKDLGEEESEILEMYDSNGNKFYRKCSTKEEGKEAVIGPKEHWRGTGGRPLRNEFKDDVGVYIVRQK